MSLAAAIMQNRYSAPSENGIILYPSVWENQRDESNLENVGTAILLRMNMYSRFWKTTAWQILWPRRCYSSTNSTDHEGGIHEFHRTYYMVTPVKKWQPCVAWIVSYRYYPSGVLFFFWWTMSSRATETKVVPPIDRKTESTQIWIAFHFCFTLIRILDYNLHPQIWISVCFRLIVALNPRPFLCFRLLASENLEGFIPKTSSGTQPLK